MPPHTPHFSSDCTVAVPLYAVDDLEDFTARSSFVGAWRDIRPRLAGMKNRGFLLCASHPRWGVASCPLPLLGGRSTHRLIGRHGNSDLQLIGDSEVSLRHLLVSAWLDQEQGPTLRVLDLGGRLKMRLEDGRSCSSFRADGSCSVQLGRWWLHLLLADGRTWPEDAEEAWEDLEQHLVTRVQPPRPRPDFPHRVRPRLRVVGGPRLDPNSTLVVCLEGPEMLAELPEDCPDAIGYLTMAGNRMVNLSPASLEKGVLVGRYDRCAVGGWWLQQDTTVSRVHLCLVNDPTGLWAVDTNSSNGSWSPGGRFRAVRLGLKLKMTLGAARFCWQMHR